MLFIHLWEAKSDEITWSEFHRHNSHIYLVCPIYNGFLKALIHMSAIILGCKKLFRLFHVSKSCAGE